MDREAAPPWGEVVTILRVIRGWNRRQLADAAGLSGGAISRYEEGQAGARRAPGRGDGLPAPSRRPHPVVSALGQGGEAGPPGRRHPGPP
jgi:hypothetical protein